jgi:ribosomal protein S18 acetylase RimI-like enzyme
MTGVAVRPVRQSEYAEIARITVAAYRADGQLGGEHGYDRVLADVAARAAHGEVLVAVDDRSGSPRGAGRAEPDWSEGDRVLGSVLFVLPGTEYAELSRPGEAEFRMLAVDPDAQGRGVGEALVRACLDRAAEHGCTAMVICTRDFSAPAHRLYGRLGFVRTPELDWSPAPGVNLLAMRKDLRTEPAGARAARARVDRPAAGPQEH